MMHRYENSGALTGLQRVREMSLIDGHIFVTPEQTKDEFQRTPNYHSTFTEDFNLTDYRFRYHIVILKISHKYFDNDEMGKCSTYALNSYG